jgi:hypothetical protein
MAFQFKFIGFMEIHYMFHVFLLELHHASINPRKFYDAPSSIEIDDEHEYEVENILESRIFNCQL